MSGSVIRASGWAVDNEDQYLAVSPSGEAVYLYQTSNKFNKEEDNIVKLHEKADFENIQCINYSGLTPGLTAVGQLDGRCLLFDIRSPENKSFVLKPW